jgi:DNA-binding FrmR family transcriptional regulator
MKEKLEKRISEVKTMQEGLAKDLQELEVKKQEVLKQIFACQGAIQELEMLLKEEV